MEYWQAFLRFEYANEVLMICGALLVFIATMKIVRSSLKLVFWVLLAGVGAASVSYGMSGSPINLPGTGNIDLTDIIGPGKNMSLDVLEVLCVKLSERDEG
jgi:hypothetical protein